MSGVKFLAHSQLHEVLFHFLEGEDVLQYRAIHSMCDAVVQNYARTHLQDVLGQDLTPKDNCCPRSIHAGLLFLLLQNGEDIKQILTASPVGIRSISPQLVHEKRDSLFSKAVDIIIAATTPDLARNLICLDFGMTSKDVAEALIALVATPGNALVSLKASNKYGNISNDVIQLLANNCPQLQYLGISWTHIRDDSMKLFAMNCTQLIALDASNSLITDATIMAIAENCRQLQSLNVSKTRGRITDDSIKLVATSCLALRSLNVSATQGAISDVSIQAVAMNCRHLRSLNVGYTLAKVTDASIKLIAVNCPELRSLGLDFTYGRITDESIKLVAANCPQLQMLEVNNMYGEVTDESIKDIAEKCPKLQFLDVGNNERITDKSIAVVATNCHRLRFLDVAHTSVTEKSFKLLAARGLQLLSFHPIKETHSECWISRSAKIRDRQLEMEDYDS